MTEDLKNYSLNDREETFQMYLNNSIYGLVALLIITTPFFALAQKIKYLHLVTFAFAVLGITYSIFSHEIRSYTLKYNLVMANHYSFMTIVAAITGGADSPIINFYIVVAILSSVTGKTKNSLPWTLFGFVFYTSLNLINIDLYFHNELQNTEASLVRYFCLSASIFYISFMCIAFRKKNEKIQSKNKTINSKANQLEHLKALGQMAGGVAHEINNPLSIISGCASSIKKNISKDEINKEKLHKNLETIQKTIQRTSQIIRGMRNLSRNGEGDSGESFIIKDAFDDVFSFLNKKFRLRSIDIKFNCDNTLLEKAVHFRRVQLSQVFLNILNNSFDAIEHQEKPWIEIKLLNQHTHLDIIFTDSGSGIDEELVNLIFNPLFTTKDVGKGTGLGLSLCHTIMSKNNGEIKINKNSKNTSFILSVPYNDMTIIKKAA